MKKTLRILSLSLVLLLVLATPLLATGCQTKAPKVLNIFTWADYFPQDVLDTFAKDANVTINYTHFSTNEEMLNKLQAVKGGEYDIVLASDYIIDIARGENLLKELDKAKIPNFANINPGYQSKFYDPENLYTVPYAAGTPLIVYDPSKVSFPITGYDDLWNPALKDSLVVMDDMRNIIGITLKSLGYSLNATDPAQLEQAKAKLFELKPNIRIMDYDRPQDKLISGEVSVAYMFTPQVVQAVQANPNFTVVYPKEGMGFGIDSCFVPVNAPNADVAYEFLNYILDGKVSAAISETALYINCVTTAEPFLSPEYLSNKALFIPADVLGTVEFMMDVGDATPIYDSIWVEFGTLK